MHDVFLATGLVEKQATFCSKYTTTTPPDSRVPCQDMMKDTVMKDTVILPYFIYETDVFMKLLNMDKKALFPGQ